MGTEEEIKRYKRRLYILYCVEIVSDNPKEVFQTKRVRGVCMSGLRNVY